MDQQQLLFLLLSLLLLLVVVVVIMVLIIFALRNWQKSVALQNYTNTNTHFYRTSLLDVVVIIMVMLRGQIRIMWKIRPLALNIYDRPMFWSKYLIVPQRQWVESLLLKYKDKAKPYALAGELLGHSLVTSEETIWKLKKKLALSAFTPKTIKENYLKIFNVHNRILQDELQTKVDENENDVLIVESYLERTNLIVNWEIFTGPSDQSEKTELMKILELNKRIRSKDRQSYLSYFLVSEWFRNVVYLPLSGYSKLMREYRHAFTNVIFNKRNNRKNEILRRETSSSVDMVEKFVPIIDVLNEAYEKDDTPQQLVEDIMTYLMAGFDPTVLTQKMALFMLASHPKIQEKVYQELYEIFGSSDRDVNDNDLNKLNYLEQCIRETLRLFPGIPFIGRSSKEDLKIDNHCKIAKNTDVIFPICSVLWDETVFMDPSSFNPDRFSDGEQQRWPDHSFIPFGIGPRSCIGKHFAMVSIKVALTYILRKFRVETTTSLTNLYFTFSTALHIETAIEFKFYPRSSPLP